MTRSAQDRDGGGRAYTPLGPGPPGTYPTANDLPVVSTADRVASIQRAMASLDYPAWHDRCRRDVEYLIERLSRAEGALRVYADGSTWGVTRSTSPYGHVIWLGEQDEPWAAARAALEETQ